MPKTYKQYWSTHLGTVAIQCLAIRILAPSLRALSRGYQSKISVKTSRSQKRWWRMAFFSFGWRNNSFLRLSSIWKAKIFIMLKTSVMLCLTKIWNKVSIFLFIIIVSLNYFLLIAIDSERKIDISRSFVTEKSEFLRKSKKTLLIFRRMSQKNAKCTLELRH